jgi:hypothetical protein
MDVGIKGDPKEVLTLLLAPFFRQEDRPVYAAKCCGRVFAGTEVPQYCRICERVPAVAEFNNPEEASFEALPEQPTDRPLRS